MKMTNSRSAASILVFFSCLLILGSALAADAATGVLINESGAYDGYTLFSPLGDKTTYLIDLDGDLVHSWECDYNPALAVYLLENGNLLRTASLGRDVSDVFTGGGGVGGLVQEIDPDGNTLWEYEYSSDTYITHHDVEYLPGGNILILAYEVKTSTEAQAAGRNPDLLTDGSLWVDHIIEVQPSGTSGGTIVWEWHLWDHLVQSFDDTKSNYGVVADNPQLINVNYTGGSGPNSGGQDWSHCNSIEYIEEYDQILLSSHTFSEVWVIDHSTTTAQAASHSGGNSGMGGDLLYRWGNPAAYDSGSGSDQIFYAQHDASWIESQNPGAGDILVFNNGLGRSDGSYSTIEQFTPPVDANGDYTLSGDTYGPDSQTWTYEADTPTDFYSMDISGAQRLPNGNTLICEGRSGTFFEVTDDKDIVWEYVNPYTTEMAAKATTSDDGGGSVFRAYRYAETYAGITNLLGTSSAGSYVLTGFTTDATSSLQAGDTLTMTATATANGETLYYRFGYKPDYNTSDWSSATWTQIQGWSTSNTASITFPAAGTYILTVDLSNTAGTSNTSQYMGGSVTVGEQTETTLTGISLNLTDLPEAGESVTISATASANTGDTVYYQFGYKPENGTWTALQSWSTSSTYSMSFSSSGTYIFTVETSATAGYPTVGTGQLMGGTIVVDSGSSTFTLTSSAVSNGELLDDYKCEEKVDGVEDSIPLSWTNVPASAGSLAVMMYHYPNPADTSHVNSYLLLWDIDPSVTGIAHGAADDGPWYMGSNKDGDAVSYTSPCSPSSGTHEYTIVLYALSQTPAALPAYSTTDVTYDVLKAAIETVTVIDTATLTFDVVTSLKRT